MKDYEREATRVVSEAIKCVIAFALMVLISAAIAAPFILALWLLWALS
jgi:hypothetical protein